MIGRFVGVVVTGGLALTALVASGARIVHAQDVPGIEICTAEKSMERRTSCLQSNVEFLQKTITGLALDHQQKLDAANRQIDALKTSVISLQKALDDMKTTLDKTADSAKKIDTSSASKDAAAKDATTKDSTKQQAGKEGAAKQGAK